MTIALHDVMTYSVVEYEKELYCLGMIHRGTAVLYRADGTFEEVSAYNLVVVHASPVNTAHEFILAHSCRSCGHALSPGEVVTWGNQCADCHANESDMNA